jgi:spermidine/putrescine transport system permease protein
MKTRHKFLTAYAYFFVVYLLMPLLVMSVAAFNNSRFPTPLPWLGFTWRWFIDLYNDQTMLEAAFSTLWVAIAVVALSVPIGTAAAILINSLKGRFRGMLYALMIAPILTPGAVIGISTLLFWYKFDVPAGLHLSVFAQVSFIAAYVMLMVLARLQSFDVVLEEAALDLGATHSQMMRRVLLPHLYPAILTGAVLAFFQSVENFNATQFTRGAQTTLTVYVGSKVRTGITPTINALAFILISLTVVGVAAYEITRRRAEARALAADLQ